MIDLVARLPDIAWPIAILLAWLCGELGQQWLRLPRISSYAIVGFLLGPSQGGLLPAQQSGSILLLANIAFGLMLFECGYRINLRWLRLNPWLAASSLTESALAFLAVYLVASYFGLTPANALLLASLAMASSPAAIVFMSNELRGSGQVTERSLHLAVLGCVLSVLLFKALVGMHVFDASGSLSTALYNSLVVLAASALIGAATGAAIPALLRLTGRASEDGTLTFSVAVVFLATLTHSLKLSPLLATLACGMMARHSRIALNPSQRNFGSLGALLSVLLFVYIASTLEWALLKSSLVLAGLLIAARLAAKTLGLSLLSHASGISWRKGLLLGLTGSPLAAYAILILEETRLQGVDLLPSMAPLLAASLLLEILAPLLLARALCWAREVPAHPEN